MDRHALQSKARDDGETNLRESKAAGLKNQKRNNSKPTTQAEVFCDDFASFQGAGEGILLGVNEQARAVESSKSAQKTTPKKAKQ